MIFIPIFRYVKLLRFIKIFQSYDHKCTAMFFMNHSAEHTQLNASKELWTIYYVTDIVTDKNMLQNAYRLTKQKCAKVLGVFGAVSKWFTGKNASNK